MDKASIGIIGLGVMGRMLALNMERNGFCVAGHDLDQEKVKDFTNRNPGKNLIGCKTMGSFLDCLEKPRRILIMVPAGAPIDSVISDVAPRLVPGDLLVDGGNTFFLDTIRRSLELETSGIVYIGTGISGGESGALWGPAIMPGGQQAAWELVRPIFEAIAARVDDEPCVAYMGRGGAGHYVKMVHNGIEYGDMQLIAEAYDLLHRGLGLDNSKLHRVFNQWNRGELQSYLIEITAEIFLHKEPDTSLSTLDLILDEAQQKGTGKWASQNALDLGAPTPTINAAVESRILSAYKHERSIASGVLTGPDQKIHAAPDDVIEWLKDALYIAKICSYAQGFNLMRLADKEYGFQLNYSEIARIWRGGCIIRARFLNDIRRAYQLDPELVNIMLDPFFVSVLNDRHGSLRKIVALAADSGIPTLAFSSALAYLDAYRSERLPANLTQAQRDFFGAHTYRRIDREGVFHTEWQK
jgi:6-phosphogluconate dehydrogenase